MGSSKKLKTTEGLDRKDKNMRILHFTLGKVNPNSGNGINVVISGLCKNINKTSDFKCEVLCISRKQAQKYKRIDRGNFQVHCFNGFWGALSFLRRNATGYDAMHLHNAWTWENDVMSLFLRIYKIPYIVSTHCAFQTFRLKNSNYVLKHIYHLFFQRHTFDGAALIHASTNQETEDIKRFTNTESFVLPNGANLETLGSPRNFRMAETEKLCGLYIGRISKEKNIEGLVMAVGLLEQCDRENIKIRIVGPNDKRLVDLIQENNLDAYFEIMGPLFGEEKIALMNNSHFFIHPSLSDQIPTSWLEALSKGLPSLITRQSMISYWFDSRAFIMMEPTPASIAASLKTLIQRKENLDEMSRNAIRLIENELNWKVISENLTKIYSRLSCG